MAKIRSHSYVQVCHLSAATYAHKPRLITNMIQFNSVDSAKKAQQDLNGAKFPPATGKILTVFHLPLKAMDDLLKEEDAAMVRRQGRMDVNVSFQQGQWSYTLVPFGTAQQPVPAAAQSDQLSIRGLASAVPMQMRPLNEPPPSAHPRGLEDQPGRAPLPPPGRHGGRQNPLPISLRAGDSFRTRGPPPRRSPPPSRSLPSGAKLTKYGPPIAYKPYKSL